MILTIASTLVLGAQTVKENNLQHMAKAEEPAARTRQGR